MIFNPAHPGEVLKDYLGKMTVAEAARRLGGGHLCFHVFASFSGIAQFTRLLAKDADTARPLAACPCAVTKMLSGFRSR